MAALSCCFASCEMLLPVHLLAIRALNSRRSARFIACSMQNNSAPSSWLQTEAAMESFEPQIGAIDTCKASERESPFHSLYPLSLSLCLALFLARCLAFGLASEPLARSAPLCKGRRKVRGGVKVVANRRPTLVPRAGSAQKASERARRPL